MLTNVKGCYHVKRVILITSCWSGNCGRFNKAYCSNYSNGNLADALRALKSEEAAFDIAKEFGLAASAVNLIRT